MAVKFPVEIPFFLLFFSFILSGAIRGNLIIYRTCYALLGYNKSECALLGSQNPDNMTHNLEKTVEPYASVISMCISLLEGIFSAVICLFVGPWSDRFGRKPALLVPVVGFAANYILFAFFSFVENASPWYFLICAIPICLTGGVSSYITVFICYITEISNERNRGLRMGIFEGMIGLGIMLGLLLSSYLFYATSYQAVFLIAAGFCILNLILTIFFMPESLANPETEGKLKNFFKCSHISEMVKTTFRKRENYDRFIFLFCMLMSTIYNVINNGDGGVQGLFLRAKFHWSLRDCTIFSTVNSLFGIIGGIIGVYVLHMVIKTPENLMILIGFIFSVIGSLVMGFARYGWEIYAAAFTRAFGVVVNPMTRTLVSKIIPTEEIGKIFSLILVFETLIGMVGSPMYTAIYNATISKDPAIYNFVTAGFYVVETFLAISLIVIPIRIRHEELMNENETSTDA